MTYAGKFGKSLALALAIWCAGTGCMLVTYAKAASKAAANGDPHACCKARHKTRKRSLEATKALVTEGRSIGLRENLPRQSAMKCCPLTNRAIVNAARDYSNDSISVTPTGFSSLNLSHNHAAPLVIPLRLPNRAHSYLLDCAFLI